MEKITSLQNPKVRDAARLSTSRGRKQQQRTIVFGERELLRALECGVEFDEIFVHVPTAGGDRLQAIRDAASDVPCYDVTEEVLEKLAYGDRGDPFVGVARRPDTSLESFTPKDSGPIVVLEAIEKPGNLGAVFRSADASGVGGVIVSDPICDFLHPNSIRNSMGATFSLPAATGTNDETIHWLTENGYEVFVATPHDATDLYRQFLPSKHALVLGNEANGLSNRWMSERFQRVCLPMEGICDSLNVSVTAAVMMYESLRQRSK